MYLQGLFPAGIKLRFLRMEEKERTHYFSGRKFPVGMILNFFHLGSIQVSNAVLQILLFPVIIRLTGLPAFGHIMVANSFAVLLSIFINYGTNQSGIKDIALCRHNPDVMAQKFYPVFFIRLILCILCLALLPLAKMYAPGNFLFIVYAVPLVLAEVLNPIFFFIGIEKLLAYNITNLFSKLASIALIIGLIRGTEDAHLVNFYLGLCSLTGYVVLFLFATQRYRIRFFLPGIRSLWQCIRENVYLTGNNLSVHLQQSLFLFVLSASGNTMALGAYAFCDKIIWAFRLLLISFSNAIFPRFTLLYEENQAKWRRYKQRIHLLFCLAFMASALSFLLFPELIVSLFIGERNSLGITYVRAIAFTPLMIALNSLNLLELLIRNAYAAIFRISLMVLAVSALSSFLLMRTNEPAYYAYYPLLVETTCLALFLFYLRKNHHYPSKLTV